MPAIFRHHVFAPLARCRRSSLALFVLLACATVCACDDTTPSPATTRSESPIPQQQQAQQAVSSLQGWAQQATAGAAPTPRPASDALVVPIIHTVD
jgi:outer membrane biogenesis lipoprotein LolB